MRNRNNKAFTLIELLAVIVILALITLLAVTKIRDFLKKSDTGTVESNAKIYVKAVNDMASMSIREEVKYIEGEYTVDDLKDVIKVNGTVPSTGYVELDDFEVTNACLVYGKYRAIFEDGAFKKIEKNSDCGVTTNYDEEFAYSGEEKTYKVLKTGTYKLEVWGAQGGKANDTYIGGYGGYSVGTITLNKDDILYINVGGAGSSECVSTDCDGGYNGGGSGKPYTGDHSNYVAGGGGATSISKATGLISNTTMRSSLLIAAGGGAGAYYHTNGAGYSANGSSGGGATGVAGTPVGYTSAVGGGGTQSAGGAAGYRGGAGSAGLGGSGSGGSSGGGGGYFGGGSAGHAGSGGGSGYLASTLTNSSMYCYGCADDSTSKTYATTCTNEEATSNCAKLNNGYAKITKVN